MSAKFTYREFPFAKSRPLRLVFATGGVRERLAEYVSEVLKQEGYHELSSPMLNFLSVLACEDTGSSASDIARQLKVSRQMIAKTVGKACQAGYVEQEKGKGRLKELCFTELGGRLMSNVYRILDDLDRELSDDIGQEKFQETIENLEMIHKRIGSKLLDMGSVSE